MNSPREWTSEVSGHPGLPSIVVAKNPNPKTKILIREAVSVALTAKGCKNRAQKYWIDLSGLDVSSCQHYLPIQDLVESKNLAE